MERYFSVDYHGTPFVMFSVPHLVALGMIFFICILLFLFRNRITKTQRLTFMYFIAILLIANEIAFHIWKLSNGLWNIQTMLPLHLCSLMVYANAVMMVTKSYPLYEFLYFIGIGGAIQALLTPDIGTYGFPHFRFFQTYIAHGFIVTTAIYMTVVERYRPYPKSLIKVAIGLNIYLIIVFIINMLIGSNYMFIAHKLETPTLLDYLGPWPWYILSLEVIGLTICLLLYMPFLIKDKFFKRIDKIQNV